MIEGLFRIVAELMIIQTARQLMRPFGIRLPEWAEILVGLLLWMIVGGLAFGWWTR